MKRFVSVLLYLSAFLPMLIIMWIKEVIKILNDAFTEYNEAVASVIDANTPHVKFNWGCLFNIYLPIELTAIIVIAVSLIVLMKNNKGASTKIVKVKSLKNQVAEYYLAYFSLFVLALIGFSLTSITDVISLCLLMLVLGIVYIRNGMFYINPTVSLLKSFIYEIEFEENGKSLSRIVISKEKLLVGDTLNLFQSKHDYTLVKEKLENTEREARANG
jgi:hypothetical protein